MKQLRLEVIFGSRNKLSPALKTIVGSSNAASKALKKTTDQLKDLQRQQDKITAFRKLKDDVQQASLELERGNKKIAALKQQLAQNPNSKLSAELKKAESEARRLNKVVTEGRPKLISLRQELNQAGLKSTNLAQHQQNLKNKIASTNTEIDKQRTHLKNLSTMQQNSQKYAANARTAAMYGMGAAVTGAGALYAMKKPINESKRVDVEGNRIHALGLGDETSKKAIKYAQALDTFGTSIYDNMVLVRDGMTIFSDLHHAEMVAPTLAKMKFGNQAMFGHEKGEENERAFMDMLKVIELRGGLKSEKTFKDQANKIQQVITATGGRVQGGEWLNAIKTGGIAVKGLSDEALYYKMESIVQEWGGFRYGTAAMSAYQNIYQGRTTKRAANNMERLGLIQDPSKLKHDKAGQVSFLDVGAIKGADLFKKDQFAWMEQVLLPQLAAKGITEKGAILDAIGSIFTNRTASNLFGDMYLQRDIINKSAKMNAGADNVDQLYGKAKNTAAGQELETKANLNDAYLRFGQTILPIYVKALQVATNGLQNFTGWMERNPVLAKILGAGLIGIAASLIVIGGALAIFSPLILGMLSLKLIMASSAGTASLLGRSFAILPAVFNIAKAAFLGLGKVFLWLGRLMLANPIGLAITAIGVAAYLIYRNWIPVKTFFIGLWSSVKNVFSTFTTWLQSTWSGLTSSVINTFGALWGKIGNAFNTGIQFIKNIIRNVDTIFSENPFLHFLLPIIGIPRIIIANWSSISTFFTTLWNIVGSTFSTYINWITNIVVSGFNLARNFILSAWTNVNTFFSGVWMTVASIFSTYLTIIYTTVSSIFNNVRGFVSVIWNNIKSIVATAWQGLCNIFSAISPLPYIISTFNSVFTFLSGLYSRMMSIGSNIIQGLIDGIKSGFESLKTVWASINSYMPDFMRKKMDIHSPSRVFAGIGGHIMSGLQVGLQKGFPYLQQKFSDVMGIFNPNIPDLLQKIDVKPALAKISTQHTQPISKSRGDVMVQGDTVTIQIHAAPGQNLQELQRMVEGIFDRREREKTTRIRNSYIDQE